ncbi:hypothetical protein [Phenylobacterium aquaticum]|uniref:hypothetical protein n=1 Tax=Phenylobacterium aquaticum TaxID=1763816 RepID=UPI001F5DD9EE|nr:hypothetical protein [Phenylobacterium aquaticum]MCI3132740.1 hypothetical protein [Phenylobacterium aquaticum]
MNNLNCLWLMRSFPRPTRGGAHFYSGVLIDALAKIASRIDVVCNVDEQCIDAFEAEPENEVITWHPIRGNTKNRIFAIGSDLPAEAYRFSKRAYRHAVDDLLRKNVYEIIFIDHIGSGWIVEGLKAFLVENNLPTKIVYVSHNAEGAVRREVAQFMERSLSKKIFSLMDAEKAVDLEHRMLSCADALTGITSDDVRGQLPLLAGNVAIDLPPEYIGERVEARLIDESTPRRVILFGSIDWQAKIESFIKFVRVAEPIFVAGGVSLDVVGPVAPEVAKFIEQKSWIRRVGFVPSPTEFCLNSRIGLMLDQVGGGFKTKLLTYFFSRTPMVGFRGQLQGLDAFKDGEDYQSCPTIEEIAEFVAKNIDNFELLNRMQQGAFEVASRVFSPVNLEAQLSRLIADLGAQTSIIPAPRRARQPVRLLRNFMGHPRVQKNDILRKASAYLLQVPRTLARIQSKREEFLGNPPIIVNSIPKSGTHLVMEVAKSFPRKVYFGSFLAQFPSITMLKRSQRAVNTHILRIVPGEVVGAHLNHTPETAAALKKINAIVIFVYRDPRDIALSEADYIAEMSTFHAMHRKFKGLDPEQRVALAIRGTDDGRFPSIRDRLMPYAGWMDEDGVICLTYESLMGPEREKILREICREVSARDRRALDVDKFLIKLDAAIDPGRSHTFRGGGVSKWRANMSSDNIEIFNASTGDLGEMFKTS